LRQERLRSEIEPVAARDFVRFLFVWQQVTEQTRLEGPDALPAALASLEGFEAPANAWETEILPARAGARNWPHLLLGRGKYPRHFPYGRLGDGSRADYSERVRWAPLRRGGFAPQLRCRAI
jgi:hypothetical protein